jgi:hypothetical protein
MGANWHSTQFGKLAVLTVGAPGLSERDDPRYEVLAGGPADFHRRVVLDGGRLVGYLAVGGTPPSGLAIKRIIDEQMDVREIARQLLDKEFDARPFFTRRRLHYIETSAEIEAISPPLLRGRRAAPRNRNAS